MDIRCYVGCILIFGDEIRFSLDLSLDLWMDISYCHVSCLLFKFTSRKMPNVWNFATRLVLYCALIVEDLF